MSGNIVTTGYGPLNRSASAPLNAAGRAEVTIGPVPNGQLWLITRMTVNCTGANIPMPTAKIYDGGETPASMIDGTYTGGFDTSDYPTAHVLQPNQNILVVWEGGVPGSVATARLIGAQQSQ